MKEIQKVITKKNIDGYLIYDFRGSNYVGRQVLNFYTHTTRKWVALITKENIFWIIPALEQKYFQNQVGEKLVYKTYSDFEEKLNQIIRNTKKLALDISENNEIPVVDIVSSGFIQIVKKINPTVTLASAASLTAQVTSKWGKQGLETHKVATQKLENIRGELVQLIQTKLKNNEEITDYEATKFVLDKYKEENIFTEDNICIVSTNEDTGNPHFWAKKETAKKIKPNSVLLIDMWAQVKDNQKAIYSDSTFMYWVGLDPVPQKYKVIWNTVKEARNLGIQLVKDRAKNGLQGWEVDRAVRDYIIESGYGEYFIHRTGHSIDINEHGSGADLDDFEKHDTRELIPDSGFSIEPGIYLRDFGVRSEVNMYISEEGKAYVTTEKQDAIYII